NYQILINVIYLIIIVRA
ncbi:GTPase Der, partial [Haemophilus influenzae]